MKSNQFMYKFIYHIGLFFARFTLIKYKFKHSKRMHLSEPTLVLCNHTTESDMIMVASCFYEHMFIVCGEHLLRSKFGPLIKKYFNPIPAAKGASHLPMLKEMTKRLKAGSNIMLFPEGSRSFNGITEPIGDSIGKLIKISGCGLCTVHTTGGYFVAPRWGYHFRKGPVTAEIRHLLTSEDIKEMKPSEIAALINEDLAEDAYGTQRINHHRYLCKGGQAEGIENYLVICPSCHSYDSFCSDKDNFTCSSCGLSLFMNDEGFIHKRNVSEPDSDFKFDSVSDWSHWMEDRFDSDMSAKNDTDLIFTENNVKLYSIDANKHSTSDIAVGSLLVYKNRFEFKKDDINAGDSYDKHIVFGFDEISEEAMLYFGKTLLFTHSSGYFGITGEGFHAWKESRLYRNYVHENAPERKMNAQ